MKQSKRTAPTGLYRVALGLFAQVAAAPALWHLSRIQAHQSGADALTQTELLATIGAVIVSVLTAGLVLLPGPKYWFLRRREGRAARFLSAVVKTLFAFFVLVHFLAAFNRFELMEVPCHQNLDEWRPNLTNSLLVCPVWRRF